MTAGPDLDRQITALLDAQAEGRAPDGLLGNTLEATSRTRRRPAWRIPERWIPMPLTMRLAVVPRAVLLIITLALLAAIATGVIAVGSALHLGRTNGGSQFVLPPTACPAGTTLKSGDIATIAGSGRRGASGDGGPAIDAQLDIVPQGGGDVAVDPSGVVYISDPGNRRLLRVGTDGIITTALQPKGLIRTDLPPRAGLRLIGEPDHRGPRRPHAAQDTGSSSRRGRSLSSRARALRVRRGTKARRPRLRSVRHRSL